MEVKTGVSEMTKPLTKEQIDRSSKIAVKNMNERLNIIVIVTK